MITAEEREVQFKKDLNRLLSSYGAEINVTKSTLGLGVSYGVDVILHKQSDLLGKEVLPECRIELI